jgi:hypothetical protein
MRTWSRHLLSALFVSALAAGCASVEGQITDHVASAWNCPRDLISVQKIRDTQHRDRHDSDSDTHITGAEYVVTGCGHRQVVREMTVTEVGGRHEDVGTYQSSDSFDYGKEEGSDDSNHPKCGKTYLPEGETRDYKDQGRNCDRDYNCCSGCCWKDSTCTGPTSHKEAKTTADGCQGAGYY